MVKSRLMAVLSAATVVVALACAAGAAAKKGATEGRAGVPASKAKSSGEQEANRLTSMKTRYARELSRLEKDLTLMREVLG